MLMIYQIIMNQNESKQFSYYPINLWIDSITFLFIYIGYSILLLTDKRPFFIIVGIIFVSVLWKSFQNIIKNLYRNILNKPAIELTEEYFIDHVNNAKINWKNIKKMNMINLQGHVYVNFDLKDRESYFKQIDNPIKKIIFKLPDTEKVFIKTELSLVEGKNEEIYNQINDFYISKTVKK